MNYKEQTHIIVDIETLGTHVGAPILQIAAVAVRGGYFFGNKYNAFVNLKSQASGVDRILGVGLDTLQWWLERPKMLANIALNPNAVHLSVAIDGLRHYVKDYEKHGLFWAKSPQFDFEMLTRANYDYTGWGKAPWEDFRRIRDIRTLDDESLIGDWKEKPTHDALEDCIVEANILCKAVWGTTCQEALKGC